MTVDEYISTNVIPEYRDTVAIVRATVRECAPESAEKFSYKMPVFIANGKPFAWLLATRKDITFSFREGIRVEDRYKLLKGIGKRARHLKLRGPDTVDVDALCYYIRQALDLDATET